MACHKTFCDRTPHHTHYAAPSTAASRTGTLLPPVLPVTVTELWTAKREKHCIMHCFGILRVVQGGSNMTGTDYTLFTHKSVPVIYEPPYTYRCLKRWFCSLFQLTSYHYTDELSFLLTFTYNVYLKVVSISHLLLLFKFRRPIFVVKEPGELN